MYTNKNPRRVFHENLQANSKMQMGHLLETTLKNLFDQILTFYKTLRQCSTGIEINRSEYTRTENSETALHIYGKLV